MEQDNNYFDINYIKKLKEGDDSAFDVIYEYYKNHIYYMGMQFFNHDSERAKDLVQNTFSEIYLNIKKLNSLEAFYVWMNRIAYRQGCHMLRYSSKDSSYYTNDVEEDYFDQLSVDEKQEDIISQIQRKEAVNIILDALNEMDEDKRLVGYLRYFEELSIKEINMVTNIPENTVGSHLHRIKAKLKKQLESKGFTSATCLSLLLVPNLIEYYHAFVALDKPMSNSNVAEIKQMSHQLTIKNKNKQWLKVAQVFLVTAIAVPILTIGIPKLQQNQIDDEQLPTFTSVTYPQTITNQAVKVEAETTNQNYDELLLNDSTNLLVYYNGVYRLKMLKNGEVLDTYDLTITNIDRDVPEVTSEIIEENQIIFELQDNLSGVDFEQIEYKVNGIINSPIAIDRNLKRIIIPHDTVVNCQLLVPDNAGNILTININSYNISAN